MRTRKIHRAFAAVAIVVLMMLCTGVSDGQDRRDQRRARDLRESADRNFRLKNYQAAIEGYALSLQADPQNAETHFWKGAAHAYLKQADEALAEFDAALQKGFKRPLDVYLFRWNIHLQKGNYEAALADVRSGLTISPTNRDLQLALGDVLFARGDHAGALDVYQRVLPNAVNRGEIYFKIAQIHRKAGRWPESVEAARNAVSNGSANAAEAYAIVADGLRRMKRYDEAIEAYQRAITARPASYELYREISEIYRSQGKVTEALASTRRAISEVNKRIGELASDPNSKDEVARLRRVAGELYTDASFFYSLENRTDDAVAAAKAGIQLAPDLPMAYTNLCRAYNDQGKFLMAIAECNSALRLKPGDGETNFYLGRAYKGAGRAAEAARAFDRAVEGMEKLVQESPDSIDAVYLLGNAYYADDQLDKAIGSYTRVIELNPAFARARFNLGIVQTVKRNKAAALEQYNSLLTLDPALAAKLKAEIDKL